MSIKVHRDQAVLLRTQAGAPLAARLETVGPGAITVTLTMPTAGMAGLDVNVELVTVRGIYRVGGHVVKDADRDGRLTVATLGQAELDQRRDAVRVDAVRRLDVRSATGRAISHTLNVSADGLLIAGLEPLTVGDGLTFGLDLGERHLTGVGTVVRRGLQKTAGLAVEWEDPQAREAVVSFVFERQREGADE